MKRLSRKKTRNNIEGRGHTQEGSNERHNKREDTSPTRDRAAAEGKPPRRIACGCDRGGVCAPCTSYTEREKTTAASKSEQPHGKTMKDYLRCAPPLLCSSPRTLSTTASKLASSASSASMFIFSHRKPGRASRCFALILSMTTAEKSELNRSLGGRQGKPFAARDRLLR